MDEFLSDFLVECSENLSRLDQDLIALEKNPQDKEVLKNIFRAIHSVKGTCGMFGLQRLERVAHAAEDVLGRMRDSQLEVSPRTITPVLAAIDIIKLILVGIEKEKTEPKGDDSPTIAALRALLEGEAVAAQAPVAPGAAGAAAPSGGGDSASAGPRAAEQSLRVHVDILDQLMNAAGELVLTRNQLNQLVQGDDESKYLLPIQHLSRITSRLQEVVMKTRMQPIGNAWAKLPRIVRDVAHGGGKTVELEMSGQETEIDRQILQAIQDPLVHLIRNSVDHGIESPAERASHAKPAHGTVSLHAYQEGGHIIIEIKDDGAGINVAAVRDKGIERGLITAEKARDMAEQEIIKLIFEPGFSTAKKVTEVSGRGVGMDVVRSNIEKLGGNVEIATRQGYGTTMRIKIPLTLAIIPALLVGVGTGVGNVFAIPQVGILELVRVAENNRHLIEEIHGAKILRLRDQLLPLVDMTAALGRSAGGTAAREDLNVVVVQVGDGQLGFVVDEIFDTQEIVVKPAGRLVRDINLFAGATILGDGRVVLILDIARVAANSVPRGASRVAEVEKETAEDMTGVERISMLLFNAGSSSPLAVPLALVSRLEDFQMEKVEEVDGRYFIQYRGTLLPLVPCKPAVAELLAKRAPGKVPAIIFSDGRRSMGLIVSRIEDVVEENLRMEAKGTHAGILGAAIVSGEATEVIDTHHFLLLAYPDWFKDDKRVETKKARKILFVDDSNFFRDMLGPMLESRGYDVHFASDGAQGLAKLRSGEHFDLILSDIEMPVMDGFEFARNVRENPEWRNIPMLALTSLSSPADRQKGLAAGFNDYLVKFDRDNVLGQVARTLGIADGHANAGPRQEVSAG